MSRISKYDKNKFIDYMMDFYGPGGLYDDNYTREEVENALKVYLKLNFMDFEGDTFDREYVRDLVTLSRNPENGIEHSCIRHHMVQSFFPQKKQVSLAS